MAINEIPIKVSDSAARIPLGIRGRSVTRSVNTDAGNPYYVGARAYVTQTENGAVITIIDKDGTTIATITNGISGTDGQDGRDGQDGIGIVSIELTGTSGLVDTYTITYTDGSTSSFNVTNGEDGSGDIDSITNAELEEMLV